jgi:DNA-binding PadR family transcriptional regulator
VTTQPLELKHIPALTYIEFQILVSLLREPRHGLGLMQDVASRTNNELILGPGTLYAALKRLYEDADWIYLADPPPGADDRRKYYQLNDKGRAAIINEVERLERVAQSTKCMLEASESIAIRI